MIEADDIYGGETVRIFSSGDSHGGSGILLFYDWGVRAVPAAESAWKQATRANRKAANKLSDENGNWSIWFLLSRALVLSRESLDESTRAVGPANSVTEAEIHVNKGGRTQALASDARQQAWLEALKAGWKIPMEVAGTEWAFINWFETTVQDRQERGDALFVQSVEGFVRAAHNLPVNGYPKDVLKFCEVLSKEARRIGRPPTKKRVRLALGFESARASNPANGLLEMPAIDDGSVELEIYNTFDPDTFTRLLKRTGFSWLPSVKPGPKSAKKR